VSFTCDRLQTKKKGKGDPRGEINCRKKSENNTIWNWSGGERQADNLRGPRRKRLGSGRRNRVPATGENVPVGRRSTRGRRGGEKKNLAINRQGEKKKFGFAGKDCYSDCVAFGWEARDPERFRM